MICGTNWFLGYSHISAAKDKFIKDFFTREKITEILLTYLKYDIDAVMGPANAMLSDAIRDAQDKSGKKINFICTVSEMKSIDWAAENKAVFCFPHQSITDVFISRANQDIKGIEPWLKAVRERGMIPGLSTHMPEAIVYADKTGLDVETYLQPYNSEGFLCQVETDWIAKTINGAKKPVVIIKPLAAGRIMPPTGLHFVWSSIREMDMVTIGTMSTYEVEENIELSLSMLENRKAGIELQKTRSKKSLE
jgi:hypothetical protein